MKQMLEILSYNIHKGFSPNNARLSLRAIRQAIRQVHPDLIFLQEVLGEHQGHRGRYDRWPAKSQFEYLADETWPHYAYGKNAVYTTGHHGNAILSKYPIIHWDNIDISTNIVEKRGLLHAIVEVPDRYHPGGKKRLHAICVHLGLLEAERIKQIQAICNRIESHIPHDEPLIIAGDFNDWLVRASKILERTLEVREAFYTMHGTHARSFPSWLPALKLDRVYYRGLIASHAHCLSGERWSKLSDHLPLAVKMSL
jgi:endonuclease/exonuclease/phosphatase family metal-dependent hydrolase